jgi:hypothetical protein
MVLVAVELGNWRVFVTVTVIVGQEVAVTIGPTVVIAVDLC